MVLLPELRMPNNRRKYHPRALLDISDERSRHYSRDKSINLMSLEFRPVPGVSSRHSKIRSRRLSLASRGVCVFRPC